MNEKYTVQTSLMPFKNNFKTVIGLNECKTLQDIVNKTIPYNFKDCSLIVTLNGKIISRSEWETTFLAEGDLIGLNFVPMGGSGSSNKGLQIAIMVAAVVATWYTGGMGAAALAAGNYGTAAAWAAGTVAISMVASLAIGALTNVPKQKSSSDEGMKSISGSRNDIDRYGIVPVNLGTNRIFPKQAALPYQEIVGRDTYCRQLFTYGYGKLKIEERRLGETLLSEYDDVEMFDRLNGDLNKGTSLYTNDTYTEAFNVGLTREDGEVIRSTQRDVDECNITFTMPYGLYKIYSSKNYEKGLSVDFRIKYRVTGTSEWLNSINFTIKDFYKATFSVYKNLKFPSRNQYDISIERLSQDGDLDNKYFAYVTLTSFVSITHVNPVNFKDISGTAMRIKATDQLNGNVDSYNVIASTYLKGYDPNTYRWVDDVISSNPADIFRYVLQSPAFAKHLTDDKIDLKKLEEWWVYCNSLNLTYNRYIDYDASIDEVLNDICAAGVATLSKVDNIYSVIIDNERPVVKGIVTPRNSWDYKGNINYPEIPHGLRVEFRNKDKGYETDERLVFADGYNDLNATLYERLQFESCTNADLAYWYGRRYYATAILQPETHTFKMDFEHMTFNRGDRITFVNDVILVGLGQGRIKQLIIEDNKIKGFVIDDVLNIPQTLNLGVRIRNSNGSGNNYYLLESTVGEHDEFMFVEPLDINSNVEIGSLCAFVEDGKELDLIITEIAPENNQTAKITCVDYAPERFAPLGVIPPFESNITLSYDFFKPQAPLLGGEIKSDESVMIKNSDGSLTSVMIIPLTNRNEVDVIPIVNVRLSGGGIWSTPTTLKRDSREIVITGLEDGMNYDIKIRYQRQTGKQMLSDALILYDVKFIGGSSLPGDVEGFKVAVTNGLGLFEWIPNKDIDISHYILKFTSNEENPTWNEAQFAVERVTGNTVTTTIHKGVYLIKAVDLSGNESRNPTVIFSNQSVSFQNVVEELQQHPLFEGEKIGCVVNGEFLSLAPDQTEGVYNFYPQAFDLGDVYECYLTSNLRVKVREQGVLTTIRPIDSIRSVVALRNPQEKDWNVDLEMSFSNDGVNWSEWQYFVACQRSFRFCRFRLKMFTEDTSINIDVVEASITVDMPDRYESGEDLYISDPDAGRVVTYKNAFWNNPSVNVTLQDGRVDDKMEFSNKNQKGFTIKVYNGTLDQYVNRSFDYIAAGYGKVLE